MRMSMDRDFFITKHWVASTCSTSEVPMPKAKAPKAPWVAVWESPQTTVIPGRVAPCSGPITCTTVITSYSIHYTKLYECAGTAGGTERPRTSALCGQGGSRDRLLV